MASLGACGGVATTRSSDPDAGSVPNVEVSGGGASAGFGSTVAMNSAGGRGSTQAAAGAVGVGGWSMTSGGAWDSGAGSPSSAGSAPISSTEAAGAAGAADEPPLSDCMPADFSECGACPEAKQRVVAGSLGLKTQAQVDALEGVVEVTGDLTLRGDVSLRSLHALCCLQKVDGSLVIEWMYNLGNVDGLSRLTQIGGNLSVTHSNCSNLNLKGLGSLQSVGGDFEVEKDECYLLERIGTQNIAGHITHTSSDACAM